MQWIDRRDNPRIPSVDYTDQFAAVKHYGQTDKIGVSYISHVRAVAHRLRVYGEWAYMAGLLHDIVEDTDVTLQMLRDLHYPDVVVDAVDAVTRRSGEPYRDLIERAAAHPLGCLVKLSDNLHNSQEDRLLQLSKADASRLRVKYQEARTVLMEAMQRHEQKHGYMQQYGPAMSALQDNGTGDPQ